MTLKCESSDGELIDETKGNNEAILLSIIAHHSIHDEYMTMVILKESQMEKRKGIKMREYFYIAFI